MKGKGPRVRRHACTQKLLIRVLIIGLLSACCMIRISRVQLSMWPGQQRQLNLVGIDQLGNPTYFIIRLSDNRSNENLGAFTQAGGGYFGNSSVSVDCTFTIISHQTADSATSVKLTPPPPHTPPQDADIIRFDPGLLPIEPRDVVVNISYGFPNISMEQFNSGEIVGIVIDTPYNVRSVSGEGPGGTQPLCISEPGSVHFK